MKLAEFSNRIMKALGAKMWRIYLFPPWSGHPCATRIKQQRRVLAAGNSILTFLICMLNFLHEVLSKRPLVIGLQLASDVFVCSRISLMLHQGTLENSTHYLEKFLTEEISNQNIL